MPHERVTQELLGRESADRIHDEHFHKKCFGVGRYSSFIRWETVVAFCYLLVEVFGVRSLKREPSAQHGVKKDAARPDISWRAEVILSLDDLGSHVRRSATKYSKSAIWRTATTEAKVDDLNLFPLIDNYIFKLDISMGNMPLMKILKRSQHLLNNATGLLFLKLSTWCGF